MHIHNNYERELCVVNGMGMIPDPHRLDRGWIGVGWVNYKELGTGQLHSTWFPFKTLLEIESFASSVL